jgi:hypothetical protein
MFSGIIRLDVVSSEVITSVIFVTVSIGVVDTSMERTERIDRSISCGDCLLLNSTLTIGPSSF